MRLNNEKIILASNHLPPKRSKKEMIQVFCFRTKECAKKRKQL
uniref:Uncharacterized protein n=1 Tax=Meloidogyne enterolobii TaxID=390850 RepID=A0A6V7U611_MELEN|nr:unnamed protein product [Meloidogyne enterolobii]